MGLNFLGFGTEIIPMSYICFLFVKIEFQRLKLPKFLNKQSFIIYFDFKTRINIIF